MHFKADGDLVPSRKSPWGRPNSVSSLGPIQVEVGEKVGVCLPLTLPRFGRTFCHDQSDDETGIEKLLGLAQVPSFLGLKISFPATTITLSYVVRKSMHARLRPDHSRHRRCEKSKYIIFDDLSRL